MKEAAKARFIESRDNLKRKAKEKISSLMKGSGYKANAKMRVAQFPFGSLNTRFVKSSATGKRRQRTSKKSSSKIGARKKKITNSKKSKDKSKKPRRTLMKRLKTSTKHRKIGKKRIVADIFS